MSPATMKIFVFLIMMYAVATAKSSYITSTSSTPHGDPNNPKPNSTTASPSSIAPNGTTAHTTNTTTETQKSTLVTGTSQSTEPNSTSTESTNTTTTSPSSIAPNGTTALATDFPTDWTQETTLVTEASKEMTTNTNGPTTQPPFDYGKWTVKDKEGKTCIKMELGGYLIADLDLIVIPKKASADSSKCEGNVAVFNLSEPGFEMNLKFVRHDDSYKMTCINYTVLYTPGGGVKKKTLRGDHEETFFQAPTGKYYTCPDSQVEDFTDVLLVFRHMKFQPFARKTSNGDFGNKFQCGDSLPSKPRVALIVCLTVLTVLVIAGAGFFVYRRKRKNYQRFEEDDSIQK